MLGNNREPDKQGKEQPKKFPPAPPFASGMQKGATGNLNKQGSSKNMDNFQRTNKAERGTGPLMANSNMDLSKEPAANRNYTEVSLDGGITIIRYDKRQKIENLIMDAKARVGNESSKFFSKGWVVGNELAKISPDGLSITFYPEEVANLVQELIGYSNIDEKK